MTDVLIATAATLAVLLPVLWLVSLAVRDASIVDIFWGAGLVVIAWVAALVTDGTTDRAMVLVVLTVFLLAGYTPTMAAVWGTVSVLAVASLRKHSRVGPPMTSQNFARRFALTQTVGTASAFFSSGMI